METQGMNHDRYWQIVETRDQSYDHEFVYAVRSTGIYCRPSCPSPRPKRENIDFYADARQAEQAGYRACLRCKPNGSPDTQQALIQRLCDYIDTHESPSLQQLSDAVGLSPYHLQRIFKQALGVTPRQYAATRRMQRLKDKLKQGEQVTEAMFDVGYSSSSRLYEQATAHLGMSPATYRRGGQGKQITYHFVDSPLGLLMIAATSQGICYVGFGDHEQQLQQTLQQEFPAATILEPEHTETETQERLHYWAQAMLDYLNGQQQQLDLPLDLKATAFQSRVWQALRQIPYGTTCSYREIAAAIGQPTAARAVARACATNPVPLVVPCHRVIGEDGALHGYRYGIERKRALLDQERSKR
jgi:AraC family transcriptional regulator of adaptative response/methylated-DNA-[protein]-cysteine methyltransferase